MSSIQHNATLNQKELQQSLPNKPHRPFPSLHTTDDARKSPAWKRCSELRFFCVAEGKQGQVCSVFWALSWIEKPEFRQLF